MWLPADDVGAVLSQRMCRQLSRTGSANLTEEATVKAIVVYESVYGNTRAVAEAIEQELGAGGV